MRLRYGLAALVVFGLAAPTFAQESAQVLAAKEYLRAFTADAFASADLDDLHARDAVLDRRAGVTYVYLAQRYAGIEVWGAIAPVAVAPNGKTSGLSPRRFESRLAQRVSATQPALASGAALATAEAHVRALVGPLTGQAGVTDGPDAGPLAPITYEATEPRLVYQPVENGAIRLAWASTLTAENGPMQMWGVRVDALTGAVLAADDLVARDRWHTDEAAAPAPVSLAPLAPEAAVLPAAVGGGSYRVLPWPLESPDRGDITVVAAPADDNASPLGWHNTGAQQFTTTRGNNIWAYPDRNDSETSDIEGVPDGGAGLVFDAAYEFDQHPREYTDAATTNLFYWGNLFHDVMYGYGFDEAGGNFQINNFDLGGVGNDAARLEAQSGAQRCSDTGDANQFPCYGNANFATPSDGGAGRMQMYEWVGEPTASVTAPASIAGEYAVAPGLFGTPGTVTGEAVIVLTTGGLAGRGCTLADITNAADVAGKIAFIERGDCSFTFKARSAEAAGAIAAVVYNNSRKGTGETGEPEDLVRMAISPDEADDIGIPAVFVQQSTGVTVGSQPNVMITIDQPARRDSDLDAGVIVHEFGHGLSNRLTGGPSAAGCLGNQEQMGEGWSDYYGLMMTAASMDDTPRAIATYLTFEGNDGAGIRPAPYTRDLNANPLTYDDVIRGAGTTLSIPHGLGTVWSTMLWDMTLDLVDVHGFDANVYDADGGAGNQIALNLVTQGMKLQPCQPGFVDGRDAILEADTLLYSGANSDLIWAAFARRGLGFNASQGSSASATDGTADFSMPPTAGEQGPNTTGARLSIIGQNPFRTETTLALSLLAPEAVTVDVLDLLGRTVQTLHRGPLAADTRHALAFDASGLAPGVYVVRAECDTFSATQRVTVVR